MYYVVQKKEKISDVSNKFDIPFHLIKRFNTFVKTEEELLEGRKLMLPTRHSILPGQTYADILEIYSLAPTEFAQLNPEFTETSVIYPGQTIILPPFSNKQAQTQPSPSRQRGFVFGFSSSATNKLGIFRQTTEEKLVTELKKSEEHEEITSPVFTTDPGFVTLTFDDGPSIHTERILEILAKKEARAIFFLLGENVTRYRATARKIVEYGHVIGNHSYSHPFFTKISSEKQDEELKKTSDLISDATGVGPRYFRPPYGAFNETTLNLVLKDNMKTVMWSADPKDYSYNTANCVIHATEPILSSRKILLLHDLKQATVDSLPIIIDSIRNKKLSITKEFEK